MAFKKFKNIHDDIKNTGFDYANVILKKSTSPILWENEKLVGILTKYEKLYNRVGILSKKN